MEAEASNTFLCCLHHWCQRKANSQSKVSLPRPGWPLLRPSLPPTASGRRCPSAPLTELGRQYRSGHFKEALPEGSDPGLLIPGSLALGTLAPWVESEHKCCRLFPALLSEAWFPFAEVVPGQERNFLFWQLGGFPPTSPEGLLTHGLCCGASASSCPLLSCRDCSGPAACWPYLGSGHRAFWPREGPTRHQCPGRGGRRKGQL